MMRESKAKEALSEHAITLINQAASMLEATSVDVNDKMEAAILLTQFSDNFANF